MSELYILYYFLVVASFTGTEATERIVGKSLVIRNVWQSTVGWYIVLVQARHVVSDREVVCVCVRACVCVCVCV